MKIHEYFDPHNINHILAYKHLQEKGMWSENFVPPKCEFPPTWPFLITAKMADAWVEYMLEEPDETI